MNNVLKSAAVAAGLLAAPAAQAFENDTAPYPVGTEAIGIASLPPVPGIFVLDQTNVQNSGYLTDQNGKRKTVPPFKVGAQSNTPRFLIGWPVELPFHGRLFSQFVPPVVFLNTEVFGQKYHSTGVANLTITPVLGAFQITPDFQLATGLDFILPTGAYSATKPSIATGYTTFSPVLALRYDHPNGLDIGLSNRFLINNTDTHTNYHSGNAYLAEYIAGWNFGPFKLGAAGGFLDEYQSDSQNGATLHGTRQEIFRIGPSVAYSGLLDHKIPYIINVNEQFDVVAHNAAKADNFWLNVGFPIFAPPPPAPPVTPQGS